MTGSIKDYTPNFNLIIPEFNITGWHDYLEENFRSIDALFYNLFGINNYKGVWTNNTVYNVDDVLFVGEDTTYSGRLIKVLVEHTTAGDGNFTQFFEENPTYYELFADASTAQIYAQLAKNWAVKTDGPVEENLYSSKYYADLVNTISTEIISLYQIKNSLVNLDNIKENIVNVDTNKTNININANNIEYIQNTATNINAIITCYDNINVIQNAPQAALDAQTAATNAANAETNANTYATQAANSAQSAQTYSNNSQTSATNSANSATSAASSASSANTSATNANISAINAQNFAISAQNASNLAEDWATKTDGPVSSNEYSAKYWAQQASVGAITDNKSINRNSSDELQTIGVIDQNNTSTALKEWSGTTQEYTAIQIKDTNTIYNVLEDGIYKGSTKIAAYVSSVYHPDLLSFQWSDHLLNNVSWLRADTFSWQDGTVYEAAYEHLLDDITGITPTTETVGSNTITVYTATDGHKIVLADQVQTVQDIYDETGVAWYFILDTTNQRFKLPRELPITDRVKGNGMTLGWTDGTNNGGIETTSSGSIALRKSGYGTQVGSSVSDSPVFPSDVTIGLTTDSTKSGIISHRANENSKKYLYFYVGQFSQSAIEQTAGLNAELFNGKLDISTFNETPHIVETYQNDNYWYNLYSNGWIEQGGQLLILTGASGTVTFLKEMKDTSYYATIQAYNSGTNSVIITTATTTTFSYLGNVGKNWWQVKGYIKE